MGTNNKKKETKITSNTQKLGKFFGTSNKFIRNETQVFSQPPQRCSGTSSHKCYKIKASRLDRFYVSLSFAEQALTTPTTRVYDHHISDHLPIILSYDKMMKNEFFIPNIPIHIVKDKEFQNEFNNYWSSNYRKTSSPHSDIKFFHKCIKKLAISYKNKTCKDKLTPLHQLNICLKLLKLISKEDRCNTKKIPEILSIYPFLKKLVTFDVSTNEYITSELKKHINKIYLKHSKPPPDESRNLENRHILTRLKVLLPKDKKNFDTPFRTKFQPNTSQ